MPREEGIKIIIYFIFTFKGLHKDKIKLEFSDTILDILVSKSDSLPIKASYFFAFISAFHVFPLFFLYFIMFFFYNLE